MRFKDNQHPIGRWSIPTYTRTCCKAPPSTVSLSPSKNHSTTNPSTVATSWVPDHLTETFGLHFVLGHTKHTGMASLALYLLATYLLTFTLAGSAGFPRRWSLPPEARLTGDQNYYTSGRFSVSYSSSLARRYGRASHRLSASKIPDQLLARNECCMSIVEYSKSFKSYDSGLTIWPHTWHTSFNQIQKTRPLDWYNISTVCVHR